MGKRIKWTSLSTTERDWMIAEKVMGLTLEQYQQNSADHAYSTDMNAAFAAVMHLGRMFELVHIPLDPRMLHIDWQFTCRIESEHAHKWAYIGRADSSIEALNLAVLKARGIRVEEHSRVSIKGINSSTPCDCKHCRMLNQTVRSE